MKEIDAGLSFADFCLYKLIAANLNVLFVKPKSYRGIKYLVQEKRVNLHILDDNTNMAQSIVSMGSNFTEGKIDNISGLFGGKKFDFVVLDESLMLCNNPVEVLKSCAHIAKRSLITFINRSSITDRLRFALNGRLANNEMGEVWYYSKIGYPCTITEFSELTTSCSLLIERGSFFDKAGEIKSVYETFQFPSLLAKKFYFILKNH